MNPYKVQVKPIEAFGLRGELIRAKDYECCALYLEDAPISLLNQLEPIAADYDHKAGAIILWEVCRPAKNVPGVLE